MSPSPQTHYSCATCHLTVSQSTLSPWEWREWQAEEAPLLCLLWAINTCSRTKRHEDQGEPLRKSISKQPWPIVTHFPNTHPIVSEAQLNMSKANCLIWAVNTSWDCYDSGFLIFSWIYWVRSTCLRNTSLPGLESKDGLVQPTFSTGEKRANSTRTAGRGFAAKAKATHTEKAIYVINCALSWFFQASSLRLQLRNDQRVEYGFSETSHIFPWVHTSKPTRAIRIFKDR